MEKIVIIGSGAAGLTAAIYAARADLEPLVISGTLPGGLLTQTSDVENYPGFPEAVNGFELMYKFQQQSERFGTRIENDEIVEVKLEGREKTIKISSGKEIKSRAIIIATGASPRWLGLESEDRLKNHGVSACATCDGAFFRDVPVVVIGGGDTAMEEALFLTRYASKVSVIHRRDELRASKIMAHKAEENAKISFVWDSVVDELIGNDEIEAVIVHNVKTDEKTKIECKGYFAALGHIPNTELFIKAGIESDKKGFIKLKNQSSYTNIEGVFAAGDCADHVYRQAVTAAGMGARAAIDAERWLAD